MRVLGIDPGSRVTGFGVVEAGAGELRHVDSGQIRVSEHELAQRLCIIYQRLGEVIREHRPQVMAIERVFLARNPQSALVLGHARGAAIVAGANHDLAVVEYSALQVKQAVVGKGKAAKQQVQHMVRVLLGLRSEPTTDCADALACAICHLNNTHSQARLHQRLAISGARP